MDHLRDSAGPIFSDRQGRADRRGEVALTSRPTIHWAGPGLCKTQAFDPLPPAHGKLEHCLMPTLKRNDIVVIDNHRAHKIAGVREAIETARGTIRSQRSRCTILGMTVHQAR
jgi:hypothetical protein